MDIIEDVADSPLAVVRSKTARSVTPKLKDAKGDGEDGLTPVVYVG
jgi:hypothetical protein